MTRRRIAVIAPTRYPVIEPFSGGLVAHVWSLTNALCERGHDVTLFAPPGSDPRLPVVDLATESLVLSEAARNDVSMPPETVINEHHAYLNVMMQLARQPERWDVIHNHSLHYLPIVMARLVGIPMVTTLHTPPTPWLESAVQADPLPPIRFAAVSRYTAAQWAPVLGPVSTIANGVSLTRWPAGPGGSAAVWSGRIVPEKAPHLAIEACRRAGRPIVLAGPVVDHQYFRTEIEPLLGADATYAGHLQHAELAYLVAHSEVLIATPMWDEPYGLVVAEALASGTPVAAFRRGGIPEIVDATCARLAEPGDIAGLADAVRQAGLLDRRAARRRAERHCSIEVMVAHYETLLGETVAA